MPAKFSSTQQIAQLTGIIYQYLRLPLSDGAIPGSFLEGVLAHVRRGTKLNTYDFVDVVSREEKIGWQVKSTKSSTPVTWKRAKIPNSSELIKRSHHSPERLQELGDAIIDFCNEHAEQSIKAYGLEEIYYSRLVIFANGGIKYFERKLCDKYNPVIFKKDDFEWRWASPKNTTKKEQLPALHGFNKWTSEKEWAWHGLGENQLHFSGESRWWVDDNSLVADFRYPTPSDKITLEELIELLVTI